MIRVLSYRRKSRWFAANYLFVESRPILFYYTQTEHNYHSFVHFKKTQKTNMLIFQHMDYLLKGQLSVFPRKFLCSLSQGILKIWAALVAFSHIWLITHIALVWALISALFYWAYCTNKESWSLNFMNFEHFKKWELKQNGKLRVRWYQLFLLVLFAAVHFFFAFHNLKENYPMYSYSVVAWPVTYASVGGGGAQRHWKSVS